MCKHVCMYVSVVYVFVCMYGIACPSHRLVEWVWVVCYVSLVRSGGGCDNPITIAVCKLLIHWIAKLPRLASFFLIFVCVCMYVCVLSVWCSSHGSAGSLSNSATERFSSAKSISSDQFFMRERGDSGMVSKDGGPWETDRESKRERERELCRALTVSVYINSGYCSASSNFRKLITCYGNKIIIAQPTVYCGEIITMMLVLMVAKRTLSVCSWLSRTECLHE